MQSRTRQHNEWVMFGKYGEGGMWQSRLVASRVVDDLTQG